jgi:hypothetical protein
MLLPIQPIGILYPCIFQIKGSNGMPESYIPTLLEELWILGRCSERWVQCQGKIIINSSPLLYLPLNIIFIIFIGFDDD